MPLARCPRAVITRDALLARGGGGAHPITSRPGPDGDRRSANAARPAARDLLRAALRP
ncbi:hypothetical protein [Pseudonocardia sp.]|uniref:hypothetical protein n=1 Tax=Pseudonocardia sp. TaxID=60912 RepID=UPI00261499BC|nr:hypothetical protein [Pseudonocardia sp.]